MTQTHPSIAPIDPTDPPVLFHRNGRLGHIELNRPRAINALTHDMVALIQATLDIWRDDPEVHTIALTGAGQRGLCAGGDIVMMYHDALAGETASAEFWADEYRLNATIAEYPKPFVAVMDGIVLGGGIGLSAHADIRIVTERSSIGMPETGIGFIPDVGGTYLLSHAPGQFGTHLGLTAGSVGAGDAIAIGMADWFVPSDHLPELLAALVTEDAAVSVAALSAAAPDSDLVAAQSWIDELYQGHDAQQIVDRLAASPIEAARHAAATIVKKSPTSVALTLAALRRVVDMTDLREALDLEYRLMVRLHAAATDFVEGVRAQVVDKDRNPQWSPKTLAEVGQLSSFFEPLAQELGLGGSSPTQV